MVEVPRLGAENLGQLDAGQAFLDVALQGEVGLPEALAKLQSHPAVAGQQTEHVITSYSIHYTKLYDKTNGTNKASI